MEEEQPIFENQLDLGPLSEGVQNIRSEIQKLLVGQNHIVDLLLSAMLSQGHILLEGMPGLAKTLVAKLLSKTLRTNFSRIQFTPDLMPSDVIGTSIYDFQKSAFEFKKGPIFSNIVLIDEINRAPAKTQAALFEVMEERQITADGTRYKMEEPFMIVATQNPIDMEGTYSLPEAQLDRFLFKIVVDYPNAEDEFQIIKNHHEGIRASDLSNINAVVDIAQLQSYKLLIQKIRMEDTLLRYITQMVQTTRNHKDIFLGASPRASIALVRGSKAYAAIQGRDFVIPEDILKIAPSVLAHRIVIAPEKEMEGGTARQVVEDVFSSIEIPR